MVRGISFTVTHDQQWILRDIFKSIDVSKYFWQNIKSQNEVWEKDMGQALFKDENFSGHDFVQEISRENLVIFIKLQAYLEDGLFKDIGTYKDFIESNCDLLLLINDCTFVEMYVKDPLVLKSLYNNALKRGYEDIKYITDNNDQRKKMYVL